MGEAPATDYLALNDDQLLADCTVETFRASGPGGQHRNKTDSAVRLRHLATGITVQAFESRSQHENRARAAKRLRKAIALTVRRPVDLAAWVPPPELRAILPGAAPNRIGASNERYWSGVQALLDLFAACGCSVADTARTLGLSTGALSRLIIADDDVLPVVNRLRAVRGIRPLR